MTGRRRAGAAGLGAVLAVLLAVLLAGCTSDGGTVSPTSATPPSTSVSTTPPSSPDSSVPNPPTETETPPTPTGSSTPTTAPPTTGTTAPPALAACEDLAVAVTRVPGGGGVTYGLISVTSRQGTACSLPGVPSVRLLDANRAAMTGTASADGSAPGGLALAPGATASTLLEDRSATCQASTRSSFVEVQATPAAARVVAALALPPCALSVKPFVSGTSPEP